jgi:hypothetical protein
MLQDVRSLSVNTSSDLCSTRLPAQKAREDIKNVTFWLLTFIPPSLCNSVLRFRLRWLMNSWQRYKSLCRDQIPAELDHQVVENYVMKPINLRILRFPKQYGWRFHSSRIWRCLTGWSDPGVSVSGRLDIQRTNAIIPQCNITPSRTVSLRTNLLVPCEIRGNCLIKQKEFIIVSIYKNHNKTGSIFGHITTLNYIQNFSQRCSLYL